MEIISYREIDPKERYCIVFDKLLDETIFDVKLCDFDYIKVYKLVRADFSIPSERRVCGNIVANWRRTYNAKCWWWLNKGGRPHNLPTYLRECANDLMRALIQKFINYNKLYV